MLADTDRQPSADLEEEQTGTQVQPDARSYSNPIDRELDAEPLAELPSTVSNLLQLALGGPGPPSAAKVRAWHFLALVGLCSTAYWGFALCLVIDEALHHAAVPWMVFCTISGMSWGVSARARWVVLLGAHRSSGRQLTSAASAFA